MILPTDARLQPVDAAEVAQVLVDQVAKGPGGRLPHFVGPQILTLGQIARMWMDDRGVPKPMIRLPVPGKLGRALPDGQLTEPEARHGTKVWAEWLRLTSG